MDKYNWLQNQQKSGKLDVRKIGFLKKVNKTGKINSRGGIVNFLEMSSFYKISKNSWKTMKYQ